MRKTADLSEFFRGELFSWKCNADTTNATLPQKSVALYQLLCLISGTEKRRTAKEVLCFMKLMNAQHIKAHLGVAALDDIEIWFEEIRTRTGVAF